MYPFDPRGGRGAALIGYIDSQPFMIGCKPSVYEAPRSGEVYLGMNDCQECFWDNSGELYVSIMVSR